LSLGGAPGAVARAATAARAAPAHFAPLYAPVGAPSFIDLETPARVRLGLQQRAATNLRSHVTRAAQRFGVLVVADLVSFYVMRQYTVTTLLVWAGLMAERGAIDGIVTRFFPKYRNSAPVLFVGPADACRDAITSPGFAQGGDYRPLGFVDVHMPPAPDALGHAADFRAVLHR